jgi:hypothetical protein
VGEAAVPARRDQWVDRVRAPSEAGLKLSARNALRAWLRSARSEDALNRLRQHLTFANVVSLIALFVAPRPA